MPVQHGFGTCTLAQQCPQQCLRRMLTELTVVHVHMSFEFVFVAMIAGHGHATARVEHTANAS